MDIQTEKIEFKSSMPIQIRFNDVDSLGHVNNNIYFSYFDLGKTDYFEKLRGHALSWMESTIVIAHIECDFLKPVFYRERIAVDSKILKIGEKSIVYLQHIRNLDNGDIKCVCKSVLVHFDPEAGATSPLPHVWREAISKFEGVQF